MNEHEARQILGIRPHWDGMNSKVLSDATWDLYSKGGADAIKKHEAARWWELHSVRNEKTGTYFLLASDRQPAFPIE